MPPEPKVKAACNWLEPIRKIWHKDLEPLHEDSSYRRWCPVCEQGLLLMHRDLRLARLYAYDYCTTCAQRFIFLDASVAGEPLFRFNIGTEVEESLPTFWDRIKNGYF